VQLNFLHSHGVNEIALLHLQETYSLSVIMYAIPALSLANRQVNELNICWNNVIRRLFGYHKWESVSALLLSLGRLNVRYLLMLCKVMFYIRLFYSHNAFIRNLFLLFLSSNQNDDNLLESVFCSRSAAINNVWTTFANYVEN